MQFNLQRATSIGAEIGIDTPSTGVWLPKFDRVEKLCLLLAALPLVPWGVERLTKVAFPADCPSPDRSAALSSSQAGAFPGRDRFPLADKGYFIVMVRSSTPNVSISPLRSTDSSR